MKLDADSAQQKRFNFGMVAIVLANLGPLVGVLYGGWTAFDIVFLYWLENLVIGFYAILRMLVKPGNGLIFMVGGLFTAGFFLLHYGMFCFVHGSFVFSLLGEQVPGVDSNAIVQSVFALLENRGIALAALVMVLAHLFDYVRVYWRDQIGSVREEMVRPYRRIVVLHIALIVGGSLSLAMDNALAVMLLMIAVKIASDIYHGDDEGKAAGAGGAKRVRMVDQIIDQIENGEAQAVFNVNGKQLNFDSFREMQQSPQYQQMLKWARLFISGRDIRRVEAAVAARIAREEGHSGVVLEGDASAVPDDIKVVNHIDDDKPGL